MTDTHPRQIAILFHQAAEGAERIPRLINYGGPTFPLIPGDGPQVEEEAGYLYVDGTPYRHHHALGLRNNGGDGSFYVGHAYRLHIGWQALVSANPLTADGHDLAPAWKHPLADYAEAERLAREIVTKNLSAYGTKLQVALVWQQGDTLSATVATLDGHNHTRAAAGRAILEGQVLPWDWEQEKAGNAPTSPAQDTPTGAPTHADQDTTPQASRQGLATLIVRYQGYSEAARTFNIGQLCAFYVDGQKKHGFSVAEARLWLNDHLYKPDYVRWQWMDRGAGPRRRKEIYRLAMPAEEPAPWRTAPPVNYHELAQAPHQPAPVIVPPERRMTPEQQQAMIAAVQAKYAEAERLGYRPQGHLCQPPSTWAYSHVYG